MALLICSIINLAVAVYWIHHTLQLNLMIIKLRREISDLQVCYRDAIDGKLAVMRELEGTQVKLSHLEAFFKELRCEKK